MAKGSCVPKGQGESVCAFVRRGCRAPLWYPMLGEWTGDAEKCDDLRKVLDGGYCERVTPYTLGWGGA